MNKNNERYIYTETFIKMLEAIVGRYEKKYHDDLKQELIYKTLLILNTKDKRKISNIDKYIYISLINHAKGYMTNEYKYLYETVELKENIVGVEDSNKYLSVLKDIQKDKILYLYILGYKQKEIAKKMNTYPQKISYKINKFKKNNKK